ncbi:MAG: hypothetical protein ASUL_09534 [Candidatus Aramenus sulfurataquae]|uniref:Uncharacterized protein n=1 Tax=Candidatus Aramenus sulfurataquae TaxID=1326980 RepID=W7KGV9_9CREN|nr:MAG: hypothetical protein ASUL_09534 [Candidatus Aramenus sulfurataquae]
MAEPMSMLTNELTGIVDGVDIVPEDGTAIITVDNENLRLSMEVRPSYVFGDPHGFEILMITLLLKKERKEYEYYIFTHNKDTAIPYVVAYKNGKIKQVHSRYYVASLSGLKHIFLEAKKGKVPRAIREIFSPVW